MKQFALILGLLAVCSAAFADTRARDGMKAELICHTPNVADAGYSVTIASGGFWFHHEAVVSGITIMGAERIASFIITKTENGNVTTYVDTKTMGQEFRLVVDNSVEGTDGNADFFAGTQRGKYDGRLSCFPA